MQFSKECTTTQITMPESEDYQSIHEAGKDRDPTTVCVQLRPLKSDIIIRFLVLQCEILVKSPHWHLLRFSISTIKYMCNLYNSIIVLLVLQIFCKKVSNPAFRLPEVLPSFYHEEMTTSGETDQLSADVVINCCISRGVMQEINFIFQTFYFLVVVYLSGPVTKTKVNVQIQRPVRCHLLAKCCEGLY